MILQDDGKSPAWAPLEREGAQAGLLTVHYTGYVLRRKALDDAAVDFMRCMRGRGVLDDRRFLR